METQQVAEGGDRSLKWQYNLPANWTTAMPISTGAGHYLLAYDKGDGHVLGADIDIIDDGSNVSVEWQQVICDPPLPGGLTSIMPFVGMPYFLAYSDGDETATLANVTVDDQGIGITTRGISGVPGTSAFMPFVFEALLPNVQKQAFLLAYNAVQGTITISRIEAAGRIVPQAPIDWGTGWTIFMPFVGWPYFLSYKPDEGAIRVASVSLNDSELSIESKEQDDWDRGWTSLTPLAAVPGPLFLAYDNTNTAHIPKIYSMVYKPDLWFGPKEYEQWAEGTQAIGAFSDQDSLYEYYLSYQRANALRGDPNTLLTINASVKPGHPLP